MMGLRAGRVVFYVVDEEVFVKAVVGRVWNYQKGIVDLANFPDKQETRLHSWHKIRYSPTKEINSWHFIIDLSLFYPQIDSNVVISEEKKETE